MLSKAITNICGKGNFILSNVLARRAMAGGYVQPHKKRIPDSHMNDIPLPEPFQEVHQKRQTGNNFVFIAGILFFTLSAGYVLNSGVITANLTPPRKNPE
ncbi:hypothetical protein JTE90_014529 [Oedothorax gibbosus]|uniref:Deltamethrin resistance protein prag01 domain-containing protein n=1 Tax=Oedothorax gibbosus TaxID=931172 RepID=A0AAV6UWZ1_9ARAC|nr:hypothetical protein JTE90_014529 [Oedothorax gibbosus]